jgi:ABC-type antimicrobial peptide transport system ATPase subunit
MKPAAASEHRPSSSPSVGVDSHRDAFTKSRRRAVRFPREPAVAGNYRAGKRTTLRMIVGLAAPTSGTARVMGCP